MRFVLVSVYESDKQAYGEYDIKGKQLHIHITPAPPCKCVHAHTGIQCTV